MFANKKLDRFCIVGLICLSMATATFFILKALEDKIIFFYTPSNLLEKKIEKEEYVRLGGLVSPKSVNYSEDGHDVKFSITDNKRLIEVSYKGILPDLFAENQGVVVEGNFNNIKKVFYAKKVLAKHDENYMPPEIKKAIKGNN